MTHDELKRKMGHGLQPKHADYTLTTEEGEALNLVIRRPKPAVSEELLRLSASAEREARDNPSLVTDLMRRVVLETVFAPGAVTPLYDAESIRECNYVSDLFRAGLKAVVGSVGGEVADAKGN